MAIDLDEAFAKATPSSEPAAPEVERGPGGLLPAGDYEGVVASAEVRKGFKPWVEQELSLRLQVDTGESSGRTTFCDVELAPLTGRDGEISEGKVRFVKWQITDVLGYEGKLSELAQHTDQFVGTRVAFEQKIRLAAKINPATGTPYENREVTLKSRLGAAAPGSDNPFSGGANAAPDTRDFQPIAPTAEDDDIPF